MLLEICANSYQSAVNAEKAGAQRIELCIELGVGGVTPSYGLLKKVMDKLSIPVFVLIRPRSGNFVYTDAEFDSMKSDIELCKKLGCQGIVSGVLTNDNTVDIERTKELIELSRPLPFTFHRAFDCITNPIQALNQLTNLGVTTILTSGQQPKAVNGIELLIKLQEAAGNKLTILAGGGINPENALLFKKAGLRAIHASASTDLNTSKSNAYFGKSQQTVSDTRTIKQLLKMIKDA